MSDVTRQPQRFYTPNDVRDLLNKKILTGIQFLQKLFFKDSRQQFGKVSVTLFLSALYSLFFYFANISPFFNDNKISFFEARYYWLVPSIVPIILLSDMFLGFFKLAQEWIILICFAVAVYAIPKILSYSDPSYFPTLIRLALGFVLSLHVLILMATRSFTFNQRILAFFILEILIILFLAFSTVHEFYGESFWITQPYRYIFVFTYLTAEVANKNDLSFLNLRFFTFILNPTNFITPLPIHYRDWQAKPQDGQLKAKATYYLFLGLLALILARADQKLKLHVFEHFHGGIVRTLTLGFLNYIYFFAFSYANITIPVSIAWWFGYQIPEPYDLPLLATTPQDRWRRWNFLFYDWYFRFIFFPVFKATKSIFLGVMLSFAATLFIHLGSKNSEMFSGFTIVTKSHMLYHKSVFFLAHGLLVYLGIKFAKYLPSGDKLSGWWGVLGMFIAMSFVHFLVMS